QKNPLFVDHAPSPSVSTSSVDPAEVGRKAGSGWRGKRLHFHLISRRRGDMPRGDKDAYTDKQKRKAQHIEEGYEDRGVPKKQAEARAWATVNKESGGGNKSGSGRGKKDTDVSSSRGG